MAFERRGTGDRQCAHDRRDDSWRDPLGNPQLKLAWPEAGERRANSRADSATWGVAPRAPHHRERSARKGGIYGAHTDTTSALSLLGAPSTSWKSLLFGGMWRCSWLKHTASCARPFQTRKPWRPNTAGMGSGALPTQVREAGTTVPAHKPTARRGKQRAPHTPRATSAATRWTRTTQLHIFSAYGPHAKHAGVWSEQEKLLGPKCPDLKLLLLSPAARVSGLA